jgi:hypothetical protein
MRKQARKHDKCPYDPLDADEMHQEILRQAETLISTIETLVHLHSHHLELSEPHWSLEKCRFAAHKTVAVNLEQLAEELLRESGRTPYSQRIQ